VLPSLYFQAQSAFVSEMLSFFETLPARVWLSVIAATRLLALLVVELHVGRGDSVMRSGIKIRYLAHAHISWSWRLTRMSAYKKNMSMSY
jgi:hypothetical protein